MRRGMLAFDHVSFFGGVDHANARRELWEFRCHAGNYPTAGGSGQSIPTIYGLNSTSAGCACAPRILVDAAQFPR